MRANVTNAEYGKRLKAENIISVMIGSQDKWDEINCFIKRVNHEPREAEQFRNTNRSNGNNYQMKMYYED